MRYLAMVLIIVSLVLDGVGFPRSWMGWVSFALRALVLFVLFPKDWMKDGGKTSNQETNQGDK